METVYNSKGEPVLYIIEAPVSDEHVKQWKAIHEDEAEAIDAAVENLRSS